MSQDSAVLRSAQEPLSLSEIRVRKVIPDDTVEIVLHLPSTIRRMRALLRALEAARKISGLGHVTWYICGLERAVHRAVARQVTHVYPCAACQRPVTALRVATTKRVLIADAVGDADGDWSADVFSLHVCAGSVQ